MGENKEAIRNYKQCIQTLSNIESYHAALICIYPFYCGALADEKLYGDLKDATERWQQIRHIYKEKFGVSEECLSKSPNYVYFCLVRAIVLIEEHRVSEALKILSGAERITRNRSDYVRRDVLYRMAELYINEGDYQKALHYNSMADSCRSLKSSSALNLLQGSDCLKKLTTHDRLMYGWHILDSVPHTDVSVIE